VLSVLFARDTDCMSMSTEVIKYVSLIACDGRSPDEIKLGIEVQHYRDGFRLKMRALMKTHKLTIKHVAEHFKARFTRAVLNDFFQARNWNEQVLDALCDLRDDPTIVTPPPSRKRKLGLTRQSIDAIMKRAKALEDNFDYDDLRLQHKIHGAALHIEIQLLDCFGTQK
jgi:hypothetical protein